MTNKVETKQSADGMNWKHLIPTCSASQTLIRALSVLGRNTVYKLGAGGIDPTAHFYPACDCSGFVAWSIGIPRELPPASGGWLSTDCIWAGGAAVSAGLFTEKTMVEAVPGDLLVYPHYPNYLRDRKANHGHIGIIVETAGNLPSKVIHCSLGNYTHYNDAVRITDPSVFLSLNHPTRAMQVNYPLLKEYL